MSHNLLSLGTIMSLSASASTKMASSTTIQWRLCPLELSLAASISIEEPFLNR
nr:MAG TPA: hypothetical protein [Caudoviricetes sp.]